MKDLLGSCLCWNYTPHDLLIIHPVEASMMVSFLLKREANLIRAFICGSNDKR